MSEKVITVIPVKKKVLTSYNVLSSTMFSIFVILNVISVNIPTILASIHLLALFLFVMIPSIFNTLFLHFKFKENINKEIENREAK